MKFKFTAILLLVIMKSYAYDITHDTTVSNTWTPSDGILRWYKGIISGGGTVNAAYIVAPAYAQLFDTSMKFTNCKAERWSIMWMGASSLLADNYYPIQRSFDVCVKNPIYYCLIPGGNYSYSLPLKVQNNVNNVYQGTQLNVIGEGGYWADVSILTYTSTTGFGFSFQYAKGGSFSGINLRGKWVAPLKSSPAYYSIPLDSFTDRNGLCGSDYRGLVIDWDGSRNTGGTTGLKIHDCHIEGWAVNISISPNGVTQNADNLKFETIQCSNAQIGIQSNQPQEKGNRITDIYSWGSIHTLISIGNGNGGSGFYTIDGGNVAGSCVRLFDIKQGGWFSSTITNYYGESFGTVGNFSTGDGHYKNPIKISHCGFYLATEAEAGKRTELASNSYAIEFDACQFAHYGNFTDTITFSGKATMKNCGIYSNPLKGFVDYEVVDYPSPPPSRVQISRN